MANTDKSQSQHCSLCGRTRKEAGRLVQASGIQICRSCTEKCLEVFKEAEKQSNYNKPN